jgi:endonuclease-3
VLSAQTTDGKVNEATSVLFEHASTPEAMAALTPEFVQSIIRQVGLAPKKSQYLVGLSKKIVADFGGQVWALLMHAMARVARAAFAKPLYSDRIANAR